MDKNTIKYREMYNAALQWLCLKIEDIKISDYLFNKEIDTVVIYGMSDLGNCLYKDLKDSNIEVLYTIDQGFPKLYYDVECYKLAELKEKECPDLVIVTLPHLYNEVLSEIKKYMDCKVISITDLVYQAMYES